MAHDENFDAARRRFIFSEEFNRQRGRAVVARSSDNKAMARRANILAKMQVGYQLLPQVEDPTLITFGELDELLKALKSRFIAQVVVVVGGSEELELAVRILKVCGVCPMVIIKCSSHIVPDGFDAWAAARGEQMPAGLTIIERRVPAEELLFQLEASEIEVELIISCESMDPLVTARYFARLSFVGLMIFAHNKSLDEPPHSLLYAANLYHVDVVYFGGFAFLQKTSWVTPIRYLKNDGVSPLQLGTLNAIAIATIVKNEASNIETMLRSCIPIASFVAILDTGSTDDTLEIARKVLVETGIPYVIAHWPFSNFADARNRALNLVPLDYAWTLMLDADEHLVPEDYTKWLALTEEAGVDAWSLPRYNFNDMRKIDEPTPYPDRQRRLFRTKASNPIRYVGRVHETPHNVERWGFAPANMSFFGGTTGGPHIHHMGQARLSRESWEAKNAFYGSLMRNDGV